MKIFLTGSASCLGAALLPVLCNDSNITQVTGIDLNPTLFKHPKLNSEILDIRDEELSTKMAGHDAVIHLAFAVKQQNKSLQEMYDINVRGSSLVVDAAIKNDIKKFINLSSVSVYGSGENIDENTPLNPSATFYYAQHKAEVEKYISQQLPNAIQLRSHLIIGENAQLFLRQMFKLPIWLKFKEGQTPKQQVIHEKDVVKALMLALKTEISGAFNLSASDIITITGKYIKADRKIPSLPFSIIRSCIASVLKFFKLNDELVWIEILDTTATVNCAKAKALLKWEPSFTAWDARKDAIHSLVTS